MPSAGPASVAINGVPWFPNMNNNVRARRSLMSSDPPTWM